jgi:hypothetical protein
MKKVFILICIAFSLSGCSDKREIDEYPIIDVISNVEKYQKVYCSDYFSSIELIPLETGDECLLNPFPDILLKDSFIFLRGNGHNYAFSTSGKFLNQIGERGQGPGEYINSLGLFSNTEKPFVYIEDYTEILEYDFNGNFIRSFLKPVIEDIKLFKCSYVGDGLFVGQINYDGKRMNKYSLFDRNGDIVKNFSSHIFFNRVNKSQSGFDEAMYPIRVDNRLYLKDYYNDTIYMLENSNLKPGYVFGFGKYSYPKENLELRDNKTPFPPNSFTFGQGLGIVGTPQFFFYKISIPDLFSKPKAKLRFHPIVNEYRSDDSGVYGIYNIEQKINILLDTDEHLQKGIINDINGGLPFIPRYYAGNGVVVDLWNVEEMKEMLTEEYFATKTIKDQQSHQKLKDILKNLKDDDNPVVVVAKLK